MTIVKVFQKHHVKEIDEFKCPHCHNKLQIEVKQGCDDDDIFVEIKKDGDNK